MKDINTLEELAKKYTNKTLAMEFLMFQSRMNSEVGTPETEGNIKRNLRQSFEKLTEQQEKLSDLLTKLTLEVTVQKPEVTRFKAFINTVTGAVVAVLLWAVFQYFTKPKIEPVVSKRTEVEVKLESEPEK